MAVAKQKTSVTLRRGLIAAAFTVALVVLGAFLASVYFVVYRPLTRDLAAAQLRSAAQEVAARMQSLVRRVEAVARIGHG
jgi:hypothetical protein